MINIVKLFNFNSNKIIFINKLLKLKSHSYVIKLVGDVDKHKVFKFINNLYKKHNIDCKLICSDFMFSTHKEKGFACLKIEKFYYCGTLVTNATLTTLEENDACLELKVEDIYD